MIAAGVVCASAIVVAASAAQPRRGTYADGACVSLRPLGRPNGHTVFVDPGHGGLDPGASGRTTAGRRVFEKDLTLAVALETSRLLRADGFGVTVSRVTDTTVSPVGLRDRSGGALTVAADQRDLRARIRCANESRAQILVGIHFDSFADRRVGGVETIYSPARRFAVESRRLALLVQHALVTRMRAAFGYVPDRGVKSDAGQGRGALSVWQRRYGHLLELGPPRPPRFRDPTQIPGVIAEPLFISNPKEASFAAGARGRLTIAMALATAVEEYFHAERAPGRSLAAAVASSPLPSIDPLDGRPPRALLGKIPTVFPARKRLVALTFDAGGNDGGLAKIAATLKRLHVPATFFITGHFARFYPRWTRRLAAHYPIANHTMNHLDLNTLSNARVRAEIVDAATTIRQITGRPPQPLFRFPYGSSSPRTLRIVNGLGYAALGWTADTGGWLGPSGGQSQAGVVRRALAALRPGAMILMHAGSNPHDGSTLDADTLAAIVRAIERRGYGLTTLPQAYAAAFPGWANGSRRPQARRSEPQTGAESVDRFVRLGLPLYCGGSRRRDVALTFDDGPGPATNATLRMLRRYGESATFFLVGRNLAQWPGQARAEASLGAVGDHTWTHPFLTRLAASQVGREIASTRTALERLTGRPVLVFRPPYGFHDRTVDQDVRRLGMLQVLWSLDSRDSYPPPGASAAEIIRRLARSLRPGSIVLLHENLPQTQRALPTLLRNLRNERLQSVSVPELLELDPPTVSQLRHGIHGCK